MSGDKVQKFFGDLIFDMRSRGLLPLAALLVAAMVAVPMYLASQGSEPTPVPPPPPKSSSTLAPENQAAVVAYKPGVRDYKERLSEQSEKDPFIQQFVPSGGGEGEDLGGGDAGLGGTGGGSVDAGGTGGSGGVTEYTYYYEADISIGEAGERQKQINDVSSVDGVKPLPTKKLPLVVFVGGAGKGKAASFAVSRDVVGAQGNAYCSPSPENCELLTIPAGESADLVYAFTNKVYKLTVRNVDLIIEKGRLGGAQETG